jgi:hypothetical protein
VETHPRMAVTSANRAKLKCRASVPKPRGQASGEFRSADRTPRGAQDSRIAVAAASRIISDFPTPRGGRTDRPAMMRSRPKPRSAPGHGRRSVSAGERGGRGRGCGSPRCWGAAAWSQEMMMRRTAPGQAKANDRAAADPLNKAVAHHHEPSAAAA